MTKAKKTRWTQDPPGQIRNKTVNKITYTTRNDRRSSEEVDWQQARYLHLRNLREHDKALAVMREFYMGAKTKDERLRYRNSIIKLHYLIDITWERIWLHDLQGEDQTSE